MPTKKKIDWTHTAKIEFNNPKKIKLYQFNKSN